MKEKKIMGIKDFFENLKISKKKNYTYISGINSSNNSSISVIHDSRHQDLSETIDDTNGIYQNYYGNIDINSEFTPTKIQVRSNIKERIEKRPVEVWEELFDEIPEIDLIGINEKIALVKKRIKYMEFLHGQTQDENIALRYLNSRKVFAKYGKYFVWPVTTRKKIDLLCSKYTLSDENFRTYSKCVPMEAVDELEKYITLWKKVVKGKKGAELLPVLKLIVDDSRESSKSGEKKKDPILYSESPFGSWYYILGAWDKEVQYVDELVYKGK
jgi:hypothetical protein